MTGPSRDAEGRDELGTDLCLCGHLRDQHLGFPSSTSCIGGPDEDPCECDDFERDG